jgi:hypothetical protein
MGVADCPWLWLPGALASMKRLVGAVVEARTIVSIVRCRRTAWSKSGSVDVPVSTSSRSLAWVTT